MIIAILMPFSFMKQMVREENADPAIMVKGKENMSIDALKDELRGFNALHSENSVRRQTIIFH